MANGGSLVGGFARGFGQSLPYFLRQAQDRRREAVREAYYGVQLEAARRKLRADIEEEEAKRAETEAERQRQETLDVSGWTSLSVQNQMAFLTPGGIPRETAMEMANKLRDVEPELAGRIVAAAAPYEGARMAAGPIPDPFQQARQKATIQNQAAAGDRDAWMSMAPEEQKAALQFQDSETKRVNLQRARIDLLKAQKELEEPEEGERPGLDDLGKFLRTIVGYSSLGALNQALREDAEALGLTTGIEQVSQAELEAAYKAYTSGVQTKEQVIATMKTKAMPTGTTNYETELAKAQADLKAGNISEETYRAVVDALKREYGREF